MRHAPILYHTQPCTGCTIHARFMAMPPARLALPQASQMQAILRVACSVTHIVIIAGGWRGEALEGVHQVHVALSPMSSQDRFGENRGPATPHATLCRGRAGKPARILCKL